LILVDTSIWVDHIRGQDVGLRRLLEDELVLGHPFVIGELAMGNLPDRSIWLRDLGRLPSALIARHHEVLSMIESATLYGRGLGSVDVHLLASARLSRSRLWTRDRRLAAAAGELGIAFNRTA
jgi:predicted nucleic acid-binding protein